MKQCSSMTSITRLESKTGDLTEGGLWFHFDTGRNKLLSWRQDAPINPTRDAAEVFVERTIDALLRDGADDEIRNTNWVSITAAVERAIAEWNIRLLEPLLSGGGGGGESVH